MTRSTRPPKPPLPSRGPRSSKPPSVLPTARSSSRPPIVIRTMRPLAAAIITVDAAQNAGLAVYVCGKLATYAEVETRDPLARLPALATCLKLAEECKVPAALVIETPSLARAAWEGKTLATPMSLHGSATLWRDSWLQYCRDPKHVIELTAGDWRRELFGSSKFAREQARKFEMAYALQVIVRDLHRALPRGDVALGPDAAAAICIGATCTHSMLIREVLQCQLMP